MLLTVDAAEKRIVLAEEKNLELIAGRAARRSATRSPSSTRSPSGCGR